MFTDRATLAISEALANRDRKAAGRGSLDHGEPAGALLAPITIGRGLTAAMVPRLAMLVDRYGWRSARRRSSAGGAPHVEDVGVSSNGAGRGTRQAIVDRLTDARGDPGACDVGRVG
jgi:hypothetical protein